jgi:hypothetical protein
MGDSPHGRCIACGEKDVLGLGVCGRCAAVSRGSRDVLVLCARPKSGAEGADARRRLAEVFGEVMRSPAGLAAAAGRRPVLRLAPSAAPRYVAAMDERGLTPRTLTVASAISLMPLHFFLLIAAITVFGALAGSLAAPMFRWASPLLAIVLLLSAQRGSATPLIGAMKLRGPAARSRAAVEALATLSPGRTRAMLADLHALAQPLLDAGHGDVPRLAGDLLSAASATALEVDRLDRMRTTLEHHDASGSSAFDVRAAAATCDRALRTGMERLDAAVAALGQLGSATRDSVDASGERVAELSAALLVEARAQGDAVREVEQLLRR